jgi:hypothetical protein
MRQSDTRRQTERLINHQSAYRAQWSAKSYARKLVGKDPIDRESFGTLPRMPDDAPKPKAAGCLWSAGWRKAFAECIRRNRAIQAAVLRQSLLTNEARRQAAGQAAEQTAGRAGQAIVGKALAAIDRARQAVLCARHEGKDVRRAGQVSRGNKGIESASMHPASDIARLITPVRSAQSDAQGKFYTSAAGDDLSLGRQHGIRLLRSTPRPALWTSVVTPKITANKSETEAGVIIPAGGRRLANLDDMAETDARQGKVGGRQIKAAVSQRGKGTGQAEIASRDTLARLESRQAARRKGGTI